MQAVLAAVHCCLLFTLSLADDSTGVRHGRVLPLKVGICGFNAVQRDELIIHSVLLLAFVAVACCVGYAVVIRRRRREQSAVMEASKALPLRDEAATADKPRPSESYT